MQLRQPVVRDVTCGENVVIYEPTDLYDCTLGNNIFIGSFVEIQGSTQIGAGSKIQSHTFIYGYVALGARYFIDHGVMFTNGMFHGGKPNADRNSQGRTSIGNDISIDSRATILAITICGGAVIGARSVVTELITEKGIYARSPAKLLCRL